ncbi:hypothetical protein ACP70R_010128 [Stipagrostis hirtigluma subsp. patula]
MMSWADHLEERQAQDKCSSAMTCKFYSLLDVDKAYDDRASGKLLRLASTLAGGIDRYTDCVYHDGSFYTTTLYGMVEKWDLDGMDQPTREVLVAARLCPRPILNRHLVSTPWGDLLQVRAFLAVEYPDGIAFQICKVDPNGRKVSEKHLMDHVLFLELNHSACLPTKNSPGLQPHCVYFSAPWMAHAYEWLCRLPAWGGVRKYDLKEVTVIAVMTCKEVTVMTLQRSNNSLKFELVFPFYVVKELLYYPPPSEVWITQNL